MVWTRLPEGAEDEANQAEALQEEGAVEVDDSRPEAPPHASGVVLLLPLPAGLRPGGHPPPPTPYPTVAAWPSIPLSNLTNWEGQRQPPRTFNGSWVQQNKKSSLLKQ